MSTATCRGMADVVAREMDSSVGGASAAVSGVAGRSVLAHGAVVVVVHAGDDAADDVGALDADVSTAGVVAEMKSSSVPRRSLSASRRIHKARF